MFQSMLRADAPPSPLARAVNGLIEHARDLLARLRGGAHAGLPRRLTAAPARAAARIDSTLHWVVALARTLAGDRTYLPPWRLPPLKPLAPLAPLAPLSPELRRALGLMPSAEAIAARNAAARLRYLRKIFATQPTGKIARRLARRLGLTETSDHWPAYLIAIEETPAICAARARAIAAAPPPQAAHTPTPPPNPPPPAPPEPQPHTRPARAPPH